MSEERWKILRGDANKILQTIPNESIQMCVTSPPYFNLRNYNIDGQIGLEDDPKDFVQKLVNVFREVRRVLKPNGTCWINIGDSYSGSGKGPAGNISHDYQNMGKIGRGGIVPEGTKPKDLIGIPWMLAFALRDDGWILRQDIIWSKQFGMPESVKDRCTRSHEYIFLLAKNQDYYFDCEIIKSSNGAKKQDVWDAPSSSGYTDGDGAHYATYSPKLIEPCVLAGCPIGETVLDPFSGTATTGIVCLKSERKYIGIELNPEYVDLSKKRLNETQEQLDRERAQFSLFEQKENEADEEKDLLGEFTQEMFWEEKCQTLD